VRGTAPKALHIFCSIFFIGIVYTVAISVADCILIYFRVYIIEPSWCSWVTWFHHMFEKWLHKTFDSHSIFSSQHHGSDITLMRKKWRKHKRNGFSSYMFSWFLLLVSVFRTAICVFYMTLSFCTISWFWLLVSVLGTGTFVVYQSLSYCGVSWFWLLDLVFRTATYVFYQTFFLHGACFCFWIVVLSLGLQFLFLQVSSWDCYFCFLWFHCFRLLKTCFYFYQWFLAQLVSLFCLWFKIVQPAYM
jgi:hypothetical protein